MKYEDKFFGTRYQLIQNGINQPLQEIRNFREYSGVNGLLGVDRLGRRWLEMNGKQAKDRKSVVEGKSVSVSVDLGGRRIIKKRIKNDKRMISRKTYINKVL